MELHDALDLISRTFGDRLRATSAFEAPGDISLLVDLSIEDDFFRATFQTSDGFLLTVTPGIVSAEVPSGGSPRVGLADTQSALDAWRSQPPINYSPLGAGLAQIATGDPTIDSIISRLSQFNGTLAIGLIPELCWFQANYPSITLQGVALQDVTGRVCLRDIAFNSTSLAVTVEIDASLGKAIVDAGTGRQVTLNRTANERVSFRLTTSIFLLLTNNSVSAELVHLGATAPSGTITSDGYTATGLAASLQALNLEFEGAQPKRGFVDASIQPQSGATAVDVSFPAGQPVTSNNVVLSGFVDAEFRTFTLSAHFHGLTLNPTAELSLTGGQVHWTTIGITLKGQPGQPDQITVLQAPAGTPFLLDMDRLTVRRAADGSITTQLAACFLSPQGLTPNPPLTFGFSDSYKLEIDQIGQVKVNGWNVGDSDWRFALGITGAAGSLTGPGTGLPGSQPLNLKLQDLGLRLISDEYAPCPPAELVVQRHAFADFQITVAHFPKHFANATWKGPDIPLSPDAIVQDLSGLAGQIKSDVLSGIVKFILGVIEAATSVAGFVDVDVFLLISGDYSIDFDPANSTSSTFRFKVTAHIKLALRVQVFGRLGICPVCVRVKIFETTQDITTIVLNLDVDVSWDFDTVRNAIRINTPQVHGDGIVNQIGAAIAQDYIDSKVTTMEINLPQEFSVKKLNVTFPQTSDPDVTIGIVVGIEKLDWV
jgi:hypothetical protein